MTTRVDIPKEHFEQLRFPKICPVCGNKAPDSLQIIKTMLTTNQPFKEALGTSWQVEVPACSGCKRQITLGRWISRIFFMGMVIVALLLYFLIQGLIGEQGRIVNLIILLVLVGLSVIVQSKLYTAPFLLESFSNRLLFTFRDDALAETFARLNGVDTVYDALNQNRLVPPENTST